MMTGIHILTEQPGGRAPAPPGLAIVQNFLNSADFEGGWDDLDGVESLRAWLHALDLAPPDVVIREGDRRRLVTLREAMRDLIEGRDHGGIDAGALAVVQDAAEGAALQVTLGHDGKARLTAATAGIDGFVARLLADIATAQVDGTWTRLKVCPRDVCRWAFYDSSKNRSGRWCTMAICGSRIKSARLRSRRRPASPTAVVGAA